jgi:hypothetical protein
MASLAGFNTGGTHNVVVARINDGTGSTVTVAAAATPQAILDATLFVQDTNTTNGGLTFAGATGKVTCATPAGFGKYMVQAIAGDVIGTNSAVLDIEIVSVSGGAAASQKGVGARKTELATAARNGMSPAVAIVDLSAVGDTVEAQLRVGTNGHAGVFRDFALSLIKIGEV